MTQLVASASSTSRESRKRPGLAQRLVSASSSADASTRKAIASASSRTPVLASPPKELPKHPRKTDWFFVQFPAGPQWGKVDEEFQGAELPITNGRIKMQEKTKRRYEAHWLAHNSNTTFALLPREEDSDEMSGIGKPLKWLRIGLRGPRKRNFAFAGDEFLPENDENHPSSSSTDSLHIRFAKTEDVQNNTQCCVASFEFGLKETENMNFKRTDLTPAKKAKTRCLECDWRNVEYMGEARQRSDQIFVGFIKKRELVLVPTEHYVMKVRIPSEVVEDESGRMSFGDAQDQIVDLFSAAKKKKQANEMKKKQILDEEVLGLSEVKEQLQATIDENALSDGHEDAANEESMRQVLPAWDATATKASDIFKASLERIFSQQMVEYLPCPTMLLDAVSKVKFFSNKTANDLWSVTQTKTLYALLKTRHLAHVVSEDPAEDTLYTKKLQAVLGLIMTYQKCRFSKGYASRAQAHKKVLGALYSMSNGAGDFASLIVDTFFNSSALTVGQDSGQTCVLDKKKLLCHLILYILHLTPKSQFNFAELAGDLDETQDFLKIYVEYVGCSLKTTSGLEATLRPKFTIRVPRQKRAAKKRKQF